MEVAMFRTYRIHERLKERDHIVLRDLLNLGDTRHINLGLFADLRRSPTRRLTSTLECRTGLQFDLKPDLVLVLEIPDGFHFWTGIPLDHPLASLLPFTPDASRLFDSSFASVARTLSRMPFTNLAASSSPKSFASSMASFTVTLAGTSSSHNSSYAPSRRIFRSTTCMRLIFQFVAYLPISVSSSLLCSSTPATNRSVKTLTSSADLHCFQNSSSQTPGLP